MVLVVVTITKAKGSSSSGNSLKFSGRMLYPEKSNEMAGDLGPWLFRPRLFTFKIGLRWINKIGAPYLEPNDFSC